MRKPRKVAIYKARTGEKSRKAGMYFYEVFRTNTKLTPTKNRIKK